MSKKIGLILGSLSANSNTSKILNVIKDLFPEGYEAEIIEVGDLPLYKEDYDEGDTPQAYVDYRKKIGEKDAYIFGTPEYNRSMPAALKNAIDVGSRPYTDSKWGGKPAGVISSSPSGFGGQAANIALRQVLMVLNMIPLQQPEAYLANILDCFDEDGNMVEGTKDFLQDFVDAFVAHVEKFS